MMPNTVFMGSPEFSLPILQKLVEHYQVIGVVTQPDRPAGRGRVLTPPPIKLLADELGLPVIQPRRLSDPDAVQQLIEWAPQLIVVAAFGQILRSNILDLPKYGCINVHASLLPRWRGAAPIQAAILNGDPETGVTIMRMEAGIDTGPTLSQRVAKITVEDTAGSMIRTLSLLGADLLIDTLPAYLSGKLTPKSQDDSQATYAPMIKKEEGRLDFSLPAVSLERQIRAFNPWPGAYTNWKNQILKIHRARAVDESTGSPGMLLIWNGLPAISTGSGILVIEELQPAGKNIMNGKTFLRGARGWGE